MLMLSTVPRFGIKNFYKEIGLSQHFTIRGLMHRLKRQYPRMYNTSRFVIVFTTLTMTSLAMIPGTDLPLQTGFKRYGVNMIERIYRSWSLESGIPDPIAYIFTVYRLIDYIFDNGMENPQLLATFLSRINTVLAEQNKTKYKVKTSTKVQSIKCCVILLTRIIEKLNYKKDIEFLIKNQAFLNEINKMVDNCVILASGEVEEIMKKDFVGSFMVFQYLLKMEKQDKIVSILEKLLKVLSDPDKKFMCHAFIKQENLKAELKFLYQSAPETRPLIQQILAEVQKKRLQNLP